MRSLESFCWSMRHKHVSSRLATAEAFLCVEGDDDGGRGGEGKWSTEVHTHV